LVRTWYNAKITAATHANTIKPIAQPSLNIFYA
jgi:hypothetical protein